MAVAAESLRIWNAIIDVSADYSHQHFHVTIVRAHASAAGAPKKREVSHPSQGGTTKLNAAVKPSFFGNTRFLFGLCTFFLQKVIFISTRSPETDPKNLTLGAA